jgi:hypothetical protein
MEACRTFFYQEGFKEMRVPRAASLYSYHHPYVRPELLPDARERALQRIRKSMEMLYDANALDLGFIPDGRWFKWINPKKALTPQGIDKNLALGLTATQIATNSHLGLGSSCRYQPRLKK